MRSLHAELTKLRTLPSIWWLLAATVVLMVALGAAAVDSVTSQACLSPADCHEDTVKLSLTGVWLGQAACLVLGVLSMGAEYSTGMIRTTLTAVPIRRRLLVSKATALSLLTGAAGVVAVLASLWTARLILPLHGSTLRPATGTVLCLILVALLGLSLATLLRDTAAAIICGLGLLYIVPLLADILHSPTWQHRLERWAPMPAALSIQATRNLDHLPIAPWPGLGVLAAYALGLLVAGSVLFGRRDA
ncbi:ABC transporter permease [Streptomyces colonosanans]|uniref:ABC transporter permease n=1 Tax=Streptomyces colonosanans TaxID=1428652 RepID=A0A1S2PN82_9ACTN|nr:ABC transporter permease [Streptomyces colonosanans]OIJ95268.1 ABC transporter permease [Streptomyces colonosanans]